MHEIDVIKQVISISSNHLEKNNGNRVEQIYLHIGALNMVVEPLLNKAFDIVKRGTPCETAELYVSFLPVILRCEDCGKHFQVGIDEIYSTPCPQCNQNHLKIVSGNEFYIDLIKIS